MQSTDPRLAVSPSGRGAAPSRCWSGMGRRPARLPSASHSGFGSRGEWSTRASLADQTTEEMADGERGSAVVIIVHTAGALDSRKGRAARSRRPRAAREGRADQEGWLVHPPPTGRYTRDGSPRSGAPGGSAGRPARIPQPASRRRHDVPGEDPGRTRPQAIGTTRNTDTTQSKGPDMVVDSIQATGSTRVRPADNIHRQDPGNLSGRHRTTGTSSTLPWMPRHAE